MTPDEQEAGSIKYTDRIQIGILRSGKFAVWQNRSGENRKLMLIGDALAVTEWLTAQPYEPPPKATIRYTPSPLPELDITGLL